MRASRVQWPRHPARPNPNSGSRAHRPTSPLRSSVTEPARRPARGATGPLRDSACCCSTSAPSSRTPGHDRLESSQCSAVPVGRRRGHRRDAFLDTAGGADVPAAAACCPASASGCALVRGIDDGFWIGSLRKAQATSGFVRPPASPGGAPRTSPAPARAECRSAWALERGRAAAQGRPPAAPAGSAGLGDVRAVASVASEASGHRTRSEERRGCCYVQRSQIRAHLRRRDCFMSSAVCSSPTRATLR